VVSQSARSSIPDPDLSRPRAARRHRRHRRGGRSARPSMVTEITNEAIGSGGEPLTVTANFFFSVVSTFVLTLVAGLVTQRIVEKRLGAYDPSEGAADATVEELSPDEQAAEARGLRYSMYGLAISVAAVLALT